MTDDQLLAVFDFPIINALIELIFNNVADVPVLVIICPTQAEVNHEYKNLDFWGVI